MPRLLSPGHHHVLLVYRRPEARPAGPGLKLGLGGKQGQGAVGALVHALFLDAEQLAGAGPFGAALPGDCVLRRRQNALPLGVGLFHARSAGNPLAAPLWLTVATGFFLDWAQALTQPDKLNNRTMVRIRIWFSGGG
jgi:hypothetical protein